MRKLEIADGKLHPYWLHFLDSTRGDEDTRDERALRALNEYHRLEERVADDSTAVTLSGNDVHSIGPMHVLVGLIKAFTPDFILERIDARIAN